MSRGAATQRVLLGNARNTVTGNNTSRNLSKLGLQGGSLVFCFVFTDVCKLPMTHTERLFLLS